MNRYSDYSVSAYDPMSFEDIARVPMMKRAQHDASQAKLETDLSEINKINPLDVHQPEAMRIKSDLLKQINSQAEQLAREGFTNNTTPALLKTNREIQDLFAPTGRAGQINQAKIIFDKEQDEYIKDAITQGIGRQQAELNWKNNAKKTYTGYNDSQESKITNIDSFGAPIKQDYGTDVSRLHSILGETSESAKSKGATIITLPDGSYALKTKGGAITRTYNIDQLNESKKAFVAKWHNPNGEGFRWAEHAGIDQKNLQSQTSGLFGSMIKNVTKDETNEGYQLTGRNKHDQVPENGTIINNDSFLTSTALDQKDYTGALTEIKRLQESKSLNTLDKSKLENLIELRQIADTKLQKDSNYNILQTQLTKKDAEIQEHTNKYYEKHSDNKYYLKKSSDTKEAMKFQDLNAQKVKIIQQRQDIKDKYWKDSSSTRHNYSYMPSDPKQEAVWNLHNENVLNTLKGLPDIGNTLDLTSITTDGGVTKNISQTDIKNIEQLIKTVDPKSFKINNIQTYGDNKTPEITITFNGGKAAESYDSDSTAWNDNYGGAEKPVTIKFKLKKFSNAPDTGSAVGFKNLTGAIAGFWKDKGGVNEITGNYQGEEVYNSLITNAYGDLTNEQLALRYQTDSDAQAALNKRAAQRGIQPSVLVTEYAKNKN